MGHVMLTVDLSTDLGVLKDQWCSLVPTLKGMYEDDSETDNDESDQEEDEDMEEGRMGEVHLSYKLIWAEQGQISTPIESLMSEMRGLTKRDVTILVS